MKWYVTIYSKAVGEPNLVVPINELEEALESIGENDIDHIEAEKMTDEKFKSLPEIL